MDLPIKLIILVIYFWFGTLFSFFKFIGNYVRNKLIKKIKIIDDMFFDSIFLFMILLINLILIETVLLFKYRQNILLVYLFRLNYCFKSQLIAKMRFYLEAAPLKKTH
jgi:hypothetical protein